MGFSNMKSRSPVLTFSLIPKTLPPKKKTYNKSEIYTVNKKIITASLLKSPKESVN